MPPREPIGDPLVTVELWNGPASALAARLGMTHLELARSLKYAGRSVRGRLTVSVNSPVAMISLKRALRPPEAD